MLVEPPFGEVVLAEGYWFAGDRLADPAHRWLFDRLDELAGAVRTGAPAERPSPPRLPVVLVGAPRGPAR